MRKKNTQKEVNSTFTIERYPAALEESIALLIDHITHEFKFKSKPKGDYASMKHKVKKLFHFTYIKKLIENKKDPINSILKELLSLADKNPSFTEEKMILHEFILNARLQFACILGREAFTSCLFASMLPWELGPNTLSISRPKGEILGNRHDQIFGQPDLLLSGPSQLVMIEMKVRGNSSRRKYDVPQFLNYMRLADYAKQSEGINKISHIILSPSNGSSSFDREDLWINKQNDIGGTIKINTDKLKDANRGKSAARWLAKKDNIEKTIQILDQVPIRHGFYSELVINANQHAPSNIWEEEAIKQIQILARDAEPKTLMK